VTEVKDEGSGLNKFSVFGSIPIAKLNNEQFAVYAAFIMWATMVLTGLGWEYCKKHAINCHVLVFFAQHILFV